MVMTQEENVRLHSPSGQDLDLEESGDLEGVTELNNKHSINNYDVQIHMDRDSVRLSRRSPGKRKRRGALGARCCLLSVVVILSLVLLAVGVFLIIYFALPRDADDGAEVTIGGGTITGRVVEAPGGGLVEQYLGIPYAKPPMGNLRYADPVPYGAFPSGSHEASDYGPTCHGYLDTVYGNFQGSDMWNAKTKLSEDCLNLNVWVPKPKRKKRTVMVWIFGGGYFSGSSSLWVYDGKALAAQEDVIVASMNYRLGTFGFLGTGDGRIKGNFGLKDQLLALKWIRDNIEAFGGDPEYITIFGESAGGASVSYHILMPQSKGLFRRAIMHSGASTAHWALLTPQEIRRRSRKFFTDVNCPDDASVLDCLRKKEVQEITDKEWVTEGFLDFPWAPTIDNEYITDIPINLLNAGKYNEADVIMGVNKDEGTFWIVYSVPGFSKENSSLLNYKMYLNAVDIVDFNLPKQTRERIKELYKPADITDRIALRDAIDDISGDRAFICPVTEWAEIWRKSGLKTYYYYLSYRASNEVWPPWMGVIHGADCQWVFGMPLNKSRGYTVEEEKFARDLMSYWSNFAKYGSPNGRDLPTWPQYTAREASYLEFKNPSHYILHKNTTHRQNVCQVWNEVQEQYLEAQSQE